MAIEEEEWVIKTIFKIKQEICLKVSSIFNNRSLKKI